MLLKCTRNKRLKVRSLEGIANNGKCYDIQLQKSRIFSAMTYLELLVWKTIEVITENNQIHHICVLLCFFNSRKCDFSSSLACLHFIMMKYSGRDLPGHAESSDFHKGNVRGRTNLLWGNYDIPCSRGH